MTRTLLLCDCAGSQMVDAARIGSACGLNCSRVHTALCTQELAVAETAIAEGEVMQLLTSNDLETDEAAYLRVIESKQAEDGSVIYELFADGQPADPAMEVRVLDGEAEVLAERWPH
mgnify:CR=1 FL=1